MSSSLKSHVTQTFRLHGFRLRTEASSYLSSLLEALESEAEREQWLERVVAATNESSLVHDDAIDKQTIVNLVQVVSSRAVGEKQLLHVYNVFEDVSHFAFSEQYKKFVSDTNEGVKGVLAEADAQSAMYMHRYRLLHQRTTRHELFRPLSLMRALNDEMEQKHYVLRTVDFLLSTTKRVDDVVMLAMINQRGQGKFELEDPTGAVACDLEDTKFHKGLFVDHCFVLVEGWYEDKVMHVQAMGFPPSETAVISRSHLGNMNFFGGKSEQCAKSIGSLIKSETENANTMIVFVSDLHLDNVKVKEKLRTMFEGFSSSPPVAFVLMGDFLGECYPPAVRLKTLKSAFSDLAEILISFPSLLAKSTFIFVPGPADPGSPSIVPRPPLPKCIVSDFVTTAKSAANEMGRESNREEVVVLATNPCRIQYCTQEIVVFREEVGSKLCRNSFFFHTHTDISTNLAKTLASQAHLCPLPPAVCPVYWAHDRALHIYPLPDLVVIGDRLDPFVAEESDCLFANPGSFPRTKFAFKTYFPAKREIEDSQIDN